MLWNGTLFFPKGKESQLATPLFWNYPKLNKGSVYEYEIFDFTVRDYEDLKLITQKDTCPIKMPIGSLFFEFMSAFRLNRVSEWKEKYKVNANDNDIENLHCIINYSLKSSIISEHKNLTDEHLDVETILDSKNLKIESHVMNNICSHAKTNPYFSSSGDFGYKSDNMLNLIAAEIVELFRTNQYICICSCGNYYVNRPNKKINTCPSCIPPSIKAQTGYMQKYRAGVRIRIKK
jgi:ribosomal protein L37AE/L43A